jgi:RND family efflux transporter MFP subunit
MNRLYFVMMIALLVVSCNGKSNKETTIIRPVKTVAAESTSQIKKDFSGSVEAVDFVKLAFKVSGQIISLPVVEGQKVRRGQVIATIDTRDLSLQYAADKASYETSKADLERNTRLLARQAISKQSYETSQASYERAKSTYEISQNNLKNTTLYAPYDGTIEKRFVENYQRVGSGEAIVQLVNTGRMRIKFTMPDSYLNLLKGVNQRFSVTFDNYKDKTFKAKLEEYMDISSNGTGIPVSVIIDDPSFNRNIYDVRPGFTCNVQYESTEGQYVGNEFITVPMSAVFSGENPSDKNNMYVWAVKGDVVNKVQVEIIAPRANSSLLVKSELRPGDIIVMAGVNKLIEGQKVKSLN